MPKYPEIEVQLSGEDGNAFFIMARVRKALERAGRRAEAKEFFDAAIKAESYDALLKFVMQTVTTH